MDEIIQNLEARVQQLIQQCEHLKEINVQLRQNQTQLSREKELLLSKHKNALAQMEKIVFHLKSIENA